MTTTTTPKANYKYPPIPKMLGEDNQFAEDYLKYTKDISVCYNLVALARTIIDRPDLVLKMGTPRTGVTRAATDGRVIYLPKTHPNRRVATKHELSHIYFRSDLALRLRFVDALLRKIEQSAGRQFSSQARSQLVNNLCFLINIFDDVRVNSLWGLLYPGDGEDMEDWYTKTVGPVMMEQAAQRGKTVEDLFTYIILFALQQEPESATWGKYEARIQHAVNDVAFQSFKGCLLIVRDLIFDIARDMIEEEATPGAESDPPSPEELFKALEKLAQNKKNSSPFDYDLGGFHTQVDPNKLLNDPKEGAKKAQAARELVDNDPDKSEQFLDFERDQELRQTERILEKISRAAQNPPSEDAALTKGVKAKVNIIKVSRQDIVPVVLTPTELGIAKEWRKIFQRVMATLAMRTEEDGSELITDIYIQQKLARLPLEAFRRDVVGRGFHMTILIDMSGSMTYADRFNKAQKLTAVLQKALDFPFVKLNFLGFNTTQEGQVNIFQFPARTPGLLSPRSTVRGITPISHAIQVAGRGLIGLRHEAYIFLLTDGMPIYRLAKNQNERSWVVPQPVLCGWIRDAVQELHQQRIRTYCYLINAGGEKTKMDFMFGPGYWRNVEDDNFYELTLQFIKERFLQFLRVR